MAAAKKVARKPKVKKPKAKKSKAKKAKQAKAIGRPKMKKTQALAELLIEVSDKVGVTVSQEVWLIAKGVPKKK